MAPGFQPLQLLGHGLLDDRGQVSVRHFGPHEGAQALQLVVQSGAGRELYAVARRSEGLNHGHTWRGGEEERVDRGHSSHGFRSSVWTELGGRVQNVVCTESSDRLRTQDWTELERAHRRLGKLPHQGPSVRPRSQLGHELLDLPLRLVNRAFQERVPVLPGEMRSQLGDSGQVQAPIGEQDEEHRVLARRTRHRDAQVGLVLREVEDLGAVGEHRGAGFAGEEPPAVQFTDMGDEVRLDSAGPTQEVGEPAEQLLVGKGFERWTGQVRALE
jgi:hypothetical protein